VEKEKLISEAQERYPFLTGITYAGNEYVGIVVIVLSKFFTLTVVSVISRTSPSAPYLGISIQSPGATILFAINYRF